MSELASKSVQATLICTQQSLRISILGLTEEVSCDGESTRKCSQNSCQLSKNTPDDYSDEKLIPTFNSFHQRNENKILENEYHRHCIIALPLFYQLIKAVMDFDFRPRVNISSITRFYSCPRNRLNPYRVNFRSVILE
ncbi:uncharacterized protein LOC117110863 [Anneissia japonica]|uniref:uncharacterized protein LOC117110863 n=1 Tax=Anneissia japonica TaxID=1529436 RepID=UPI001425701E|nr:uncharacterized protein LOC117110863 [Anneissia japonica]